MPAKKAEPLSKTADRSTNGRIPKVKKVASEPRADQLGKAALLARKAGVEPLAAKYDKVAKQAAKREKMTQAEQSALFEQVARDLGCDDDDEKFKGVLRKLATPKGT